MASNRPFHDFLVEMAGDQTTATSIYDDLSADPALAQSLLGPYGLDTELQTVVMTWDNTQYEETHAAEAAAAGVPGNDYPGFAFVEKQ